MTVKQVSKGWRDEPTWGKGRCNFLGGSCQTGNKNKISMQKGLRQEEIQMKLQLQYRKHEGGWCELSVETKEGPDGEKDHLKI